MKPQRILLFAALASLGACGRVAELEPPKGQSLPVKPLMARTTPTPRQLLALPPQAKPDRVDELIRQSQARPSDPFDLPPPTGGAAPSVPAGTDPQPASNQTSTSNPGD